MLSKTTEKKTTDFIWRNVIRMYGILFALLAYNDQQFNNHTFREFCNNLGVELKFCSPAHPKVNGQVEATNKIIKNS